MEATEVSEKVLAQAIDIGHRARAEVRFLYRQTRRSTPCATEGFVGTSAEWIDAARERGRGTLRRALRSGIAAGIACDSVFTEGVDADALADIRGAAIAWGADVVIMADATTSGRRAIRTDLAKGPSQSLVALLISVGGDPDVASDRPPRIGLRFVGMEELGATFFLQG